MGLWHRAVMRGVSAALLCGAVAPAAARAQSSAQPLHLVTARFWRATDGTTLLQGMMGLHVAAKGDSVSGPTVEVTVRDKQGNVLHDESWQQEVSADLARFARG